MGVNSGELSTDEAAGVKWWTTEARWRIIDRCLQLHGGCGYINEYENRQVVTRRSGSAQLRWHQRDVLDIVGKGIGFFGDQALTSIDQQLSLAR